MDPLIKRFLRDLKPFQKGIWLALLGSLCSALLEPVMPWVMQPILDTSVNPELAATSSLKAWMIPAIIIGLFFLRGLLNYSTRYVMSWSCQKLIEQKRNYIFDLILNAKPDVFIKHPSSHLINTVTLIVTNAINTLVNSVQVIIKNGLTIITLTGFLIWLNWQLTLIAFAIIPAVAFLVKLTKKRIHNVMRAQQQGMDVLSYTVEENVLAYRVVRMFGLQRIKASQFKTINAQLRSLALRAVAATGLLTPLSQLIAATAVSIIIYIAILQSSSGHLSVGGFAAYIVTMLMLVPKAKLLSDVYSNVQAAYIALEKLYALEDEVTETEEQGQGHQVARVAGDISYNQVTVQYPNSEQPAIKQLSFEIKRGETVAFVGGSGSGKTTLVNLLPRFIEPSTGEILLDGVVLPKWNLSNLRAQMTMVSQDIVLYNASVAENVAMRRTEDEVIDEEKVLAALRSAYLLDFVQSLPQGIDSSVGHNGSNLSGGQKQRLAIARAIYRDAPILILDEATSALDSQSEQYVKQAIDNIAKDRTTIIVAHRLSTIREADRIMVFSEGQIIESGNYEQLLAKQGVFHSLVKAQLSTDTSSSD